MKTNISSDKETDKYDSTEGAYCLKSMVVMCTGAYMRRCSGLLDEGCDNIMDLLNGTAEESISFDRIEIRITRTSA